MKTKITTIIVICSLLFAACKKDKKKLTGVGYTLEANSMLKWKGKAADGNFNEGTISIEPVKTIEGYDFDVNNGEIINGTFKIPVSSINVTNLPPNLKPVLENHLKTADFFYMIMHPYIVFTIRSGKPATYSGIDANYQIDGELTILGQTHPLQIPAKVTFNDKTMRVISSFTFAQSGWGMNYHLDQSYPANDRLVDGIDIQLDLTAKTN